MKRKWSFLALVIVVPLLALLVAWVIHENSKVFAPDILSVEVSPDLPGRPIVGERLIRPNGEISLGYYGNVAVVGLTPHEIEAKVREHLRPWHLPDNATVTVERTSMNSRPPNIYDWLRGKVRLSQVRSFRLL